MVTLWGDEYVKMIVVIISQCRHVSNITLYTLIYVEFLFIFTSIKLGKENVTLLSSKSHSPVILYSFPGSLALESTLLGMALRCHVALVDVVKDPGFFFIFLFFTYKYFSQFYWDITDMQYCIHLRYTVMIWFTCTVKC